MLRSEAERRQEKLQSDERFQQVMRDFRQDSARREAATQKAFKDIRMVGLSIVRTLNHHTRILQRIERTLGARGHGRPGQDNGRRA
jgi:predicted HD phosphohydrolase